MTLEAVSSQDNNVYNTIKQLAGVYDKNFVKVLVGLRSQQRQ